MKYYEKNSCVDAIQWTGNNFREVEEFCKDIESIELCGQYSYHIILPPPDNYKRVRICAIGDTIRLRISEGEHVVSPSSWLVIDKNNELMVFSNCNFRHKYYSINKPTYTMEELYMIIGHEFNLIQKDDFE